MDIYKEETVELNTDYISPDVDDSVTPSNVSDKHILENVMYKIYIYQNNVI